MLGPIADNSSKQLLLPKFCFCDIALLRKGHSARIFPCVFSSAQALLPYHVTAGKGSLCVTTPTNPQLGPWNCKFRATRINCFHLPPQHPVGGKKKKGLILIMVHYCKSVVGLAYFCHACQSFLLWSSSADHVLSDMSMVWPIFQHRSSLCFMLSCQLLAKPARLVSICCYANVCFWEMLPEEPLDCSVTVFCWQWKGF